MRQYTFPLFNSPPAEYSQGAASQQANSFNMLIQRLLSAGPWRATTITLTEMQQGDSGLEAGTLFLDGNVVKISQLDIAHPAGIGATSSAGSVTVAIS